LTTRRGVKLYVDLDTRQLVQLPGVKTSINLVEFKSRDSARIEVVFLRGLVQQELAAGATGKFGIKESGDYSGDFLVSDLSWEKEGTGAVTVYVFEPSFNTEELLALFAADPDYVDTVMEIEWTEDGSVSSTMRPVTARVWNDVIQGAEGLPTDAPPAVTPAALAVLTDTADTDDQDDFAEQAGVPRLSADGEVVGPIIPRTGTYEELKDVELAVGEMAIITDRGTKLPTMPSGDPQMTGLLVIGNETTDGTPLAVKYLPWHGTDHREITDEAAGAPNETYPIFSNATHVLLEFSDAGEHGGNYFNYVVQTANDDDGTPQTTPFLAAGIRLDIRVEGSGYIQMKGVGVLGFQYAQLTAGTYCYTNASGKTTLGGTSAILTPAGVEQAHIADPAACAALTTDLTGVGTGTDMTAAQAAQIEADLAALKAAVDANNAAIDSLIAVIEAFKMTPTS